MTKEEIINYWINSSDNDFHTMENLFISKDYNWCLFIGHLVIEKLLKAYYSKIVDIDVPFIHDLLRLAQKGNLELSQEQVEFLDEVTSFNIMTRYDNYKMEFYEKCTENYSNTKFTQIKEFREWIKKKL